MSEKVDSSESSWERTHKVIVGGWQMLADITAKRAEMWQKVAEQRSERVAYLERRCAMLEQELAQKGRR